MRFYEKNSGFSLLELMVVISIIAITSAIAVPSYINWYPKYNFRGKVDNIVFDLYHARVMALSKNTETKVEFTSYADGTIKYILYVKDKASGTFNVEKIYPATPTNEVTRQDYKKYKYVAYGTFKKDKTTNEDINTITFGPTGSAEKYTTSGGIGETEVGNSYFIVYFKCIHEKNLNEKRRIEVNTYTGFIKSYPSW